MLSIPHVSCHSDFSCDFKVYNDYVFAADLWLGATQFHLQFHASMMTLFSFLISCVNRELVFVVDSISLPRLNFQRWYPVLQWLSFRWRFLDQLLQSLYYNSILNTQSIFAIDRMRRSWCRFHTSAVIQISVIISRLQRLCFCWRFMVRSDAVSLAIPYVKDVSLFSIDFMRESWIRVRFRFHQSAATQFTKIISRSTVTKFSVTISGSAVA